MGNDIKGYYSTLNLETNASEVEIKKAYRNLARLHHPDRENGDEYMFKKIQEAYDTLADEQKRTLYDRDIHEEEDIHVNIFDLGDILKNVFNVVDDQAQTFEKQTKLINLSLDDVVYGCEKVVKYNKLKKCKRCDDHGLTHTGVIHCLRCNGQGYIPMFPIPTVCPSCNGESVIRQNLQKCKHCKSGFLEEFFEANISLKSGIKHNDKIDINNDLTVVLKHSFDKKYRVVNNDIHYKCAITIEEAILGINKTIELTTKENILLKKDTYIDNTHPWVVKGKGVYMEGGLRGDLIVKVVIVGSNDFSRFIKYRKAFSKMFV